MSSKPELIAAIAALIPGADQAKLRKKNVAALTRELERITQWTRAQALGYDVASGATLGQLNKLIAKHDLMMTARLYDVTASVTLSSKQLQKIIEHGMLLNEARIYRPHIAGDLSNAILRSIIEKETSPLGIAKRQEDMRRREIHARYFQLFNRHASTLKKSITYVEARIAEREAELAAEEQKRQAEQKQKEEEQKRSRVPGFQYTEAPEDEKHIVKEHGVMSFKVFRSQVFELQSVNSYEQYYELYNVLCDRVSDSKLCNMVIKLISASGDIRHITIASDYLASYQDFITQLNLITTGNLAGSDAIDVARYVLDFDYMKLTWYQINAFAKPKARELIFARAVECKSKDGECLIWAIMHQLPRLTEHYEKLKNICDLVVMDNELRTNYGCYLKVYNDWPLNPKAQPAVQLEGSKKRLQKIEYSELRCMMDSSNENPELDEVSIVWFDDHAVPYAGMRGNVEAYFDAKYDVHYRHSPDKDFDIYKRAIAEKEKLIKVNSFKTKIIVYDFETVFNIDELSSLHTYSISWIIKSEDDPKDKLTGSFVLGATQEIVCEKFVDMLLREQNDSLICLAGYNSSRFDNFFLIPELMKRDLLDDIMYQGNSILNIKWGGRHNSFDICRYTTGALSTVAQNFKCKFLKVANFDHDVIQRHFNKHKSLNGYFHDEGCHQMDNSYCVEEYDYVKVKGEYKGEVDYYENKPLSCKCQKFRDLCVYNMFDVLSCLELYDKIEEILKTQKILHGNQRLYDKRTIGGAIYSKFAEDNRNKLPLLDIKQYKRARSGLVAGRVQCYGGARHDLTGKNQYRMLDVKSLYPYVMLNRFYPYGEIVSMSYEECKKKDLMGFFWCTFNQKALRVNVLPKRPTAEQGAVNAQDMSLDWNYKGEMKMYIPTIDIDCLRYAGAQITIHDEESIVFTEKIHGSVLFKCQDEFKKIKEGEDAKPKAERNGALREMSKLFLNSLSGKVIENLHVEKTELVRTDAQMKRIIECATKKSQLAPGQERKLPDMHLANQLSESAGIVKYKCIDEDVFEKDNRPIYLGICIYAHARDHMYRSILKDYDVIYQDTDSALIPLAEYERFAAADQLRIQQGKQPLLGGEFGQFELEEGSERMVKFVSVAAKNYFIMDDKNKLIKKGFKGVNIKPTGDKFIRNIDAPELKDFIIAEEYKRKPRTTRNAITQEVVVLPSTYNLYNLIPEKAYDLYKGDILKSVYNDVDEFIRQIIANGYAYVLCSYMKKNLTSGNVRDETGAVIGVREPGMLYQQFMIKKITAKGFN